MTCLVIAEQEAGRLHGGVLELITAARASGPVVVALIGDGARDVAESVDLAGVSEILLVEADVDGRGPDGYRTVVSELVRLRRPEVTLLASTPHTLAYGPAVAVANDLGFASDVHDLRPEGDSIIATRSFYAGKLDAELEFPGRAGVMLVLRPAVWAPASGPRGTARRTVITIDVGRTRTQRQRLVEKSGSAVDLAVAELVLAVGRGIGGPGNVNLFEALAQRTGAALAASRPPVDAGWIAADRLVGQSGVTVSPRLYLAFGISGAPHHLSGVGPGTTLVAVNHDADAAIFRFANYGVIGDAVALARELETHF
jgi:electron transfer flavoprotein alpha subunit